MVERAFGENRPFVQDGYLAAQPPDEFHIMFDYDDSAGLGRLHQQFGGMFAFGRGHAGGGFVDEQKLRILRQQHADLEPLFLPVAQLARLSVQRRFQPDLAGDVGDLAMVLPGGFEAQDRQWPTVFLEREHEVVGDALVFEHGGALEFAAHTGLGDLAFGHGEQRLRLVAPEHAAIIGFGLAGDDVHEGGLARTVGADHGAHLGLADLEGQVVDGPEPVERDGDAGDLEQRIHFSASRARCAPGSGPRSAP